MNDRSRFRVSARLVEHLAAVGEQGTTHIAGFDNRRDDLTVACFPEGESSRTGGDASEHLEVSGHLDATGHFKAAVLRKTVRVRFRMPNLPYLANDARGEERAKSEESSE